MRDAAAAFLPYARQAVEDDDIAAVTRVLRGDWLTTGPTVSAFEDALARTVGAAHVVVCCNGTAALHLAYLGLELGPGDALLTTPMTFAATANAARFVGADVLFADIDPVTATIDPAAVARVLDGPDGARIKVVAAVHYAGQPADMPALSALARPRGVKLVEDACHALGGAHADGRPVGSLGYADLATFSFHPVKPITTAEGGAVTTDDPDLAARVRRFASHGFERRAMQRPELARTAGQANPWYYEMQELGFNYRLSDVAAALGLSQLERLAASRARREALALAYDRLLAERLPGKVAPLGRRADTVHGWHLYVVRIPFARLGTDRAAVMTRLKERGIGAQVHYVPVHLHPYYRRHGGWAPGAFPNAEAFYEEALSLPLFSGMADGDPERVVDALAEAIEG